jgi:guanylate kinase
MEDDIHQRLTEVVAHYTMPSEAKELVKVSDLLVICAVTAAGKNTIVNYLIEHDEYAYMVSHTTRQPRQNHGKLEQNGRDYWFVNEAKMLELAERRAFVEIKQVHGTTFYGTSIIAIEQAVQSGKRPITELDVQGAQELMAELPDFRPLFVMPPTYEVWMERLSNRGPISTEERERRFASARMELELAINDPRFALVVNHDFHETVAEIKQGIDVSDKAQAERRQVARTLLAAIKV